MPHAIYSFKLLVSISAVKAIIGIVDLAVSEKARICFVASIFFRMTNEVVGRCF